MSLQAASSAVFPSAWCLYIRLARSTFNRDALGRFQILRGRSSASPALLLCQSEVVWQGGEKEYGSPPADRFLGLLRARFRAVFTWARSYSGYCALKEVPVDLNRCGLEGFVVADPTPTTVGTRSLVKFSLACPQIFGHDDEPELCWVW